MTAIKAPVEFNLDGQSQRCHGEKTSTESCRHWNLRMYNYVIMMYIITEFSPMAQVQTSMLWTTIMRRPCTWQHDVAMWIPGLDFTTPVLQLRTDEIVSAISALIWPVVRHTRHTRSGAGSRCTNFTLNVTALIAVGLCHTWPSNPMQRENLHIQNASMNLLGCHVSFQLLIPPHLTTSNALGRNVIFSPRISVISCWTLELMPGCNSMLQWMRCNEPLSDNMKYNVYAASSKVGVGHF